MKTAGMVMTFMLVAAPAFAHVGITPRESKVGATETYTLRVPSEGGMTTTSVILEVPDGVTVNSVTAPEGAKYAVKKTGDRITEITWTIEIKAGARAELSFVARNPAQGDSILWKVHQKYSDGMVSDWVGGAGSKSPAPVTRLLPAEK